MRLLLSLLLIASVSQSAPDPLLSRLAGQWSGTGTVLNQPSKIEMLWSWELGGQFLRLTFRNEMPKSVFEGHAYYRGLGDGRYRGMWLQFRNVPSARGAPRRRRVDFEVGNAGNGRMRDDVPLHIRFAHGDRRSRQIERWHVARIWTIGRDPLMQKLHQKPMLRGQSRLQINRG